MSEPKLQIAFGEYDRTRDKRKFSFMKNLYHKVAVASVCTALGFALGANEEAKAATFTLEPTITFQAVDYSYRVPVEVIPGVIGYYSYKFDGIADNTYIEAKSPILWKKLLSETRLFTEFNIDSFSSLPKTNINRVLLQGQYIHMNDMSDPTSSNPGGFDILGYVGNGRDDLSDYGAGEWVGSVDRNSLSSLNRGDFFSVDVTPFVNRRVSNGDPFAGFALNILNPGIIYLGTGSFPGTSSPLKLIVETADVAESVPEPTTIFGSVIALTVGGWLKRKKSSQQNKTKPQG